MNCIERIRALRQDSDKIQTEIAQLLKVGQKTYSNYELGKTRILVDSMTILAKLYNVCYICGVSDIRRKFPVR